MDRHDRAADGERAKADETWEGRLRLGAGAGEFPVKGTAKLLSSDPFLDEIEVRLDEQPATATVGQILLEMTPAGAFNIRLSPDNLAPKTVEGIQPTRRIRQHLPQTGTDTDRHPFLSVSFCV